MYSRTHGATIKIVFVIQYYTITAGFIISFFRHLDQIVTNGY